MHTPPAKLLINSVLKSPQSSFILNKLEAEAPAQAQLMLETEKQMVETWKRDNCSF